MLSKYATIMFCIILGGFADITWIETTQQDFADGSYEKNIYASHRNGGAIEFAPRFDIDSDGYIDLITCDVAHPYVTIHWGSDSGYYHDNQTRFPSTGAGNCDIADLNTDGYPDFIVTHGNTDSRLAIYWGTLAGPSPGNVFNIPIAPEIPNEACYAADLNKDGYLDLIIGAYLSFYSGAIFWGSETGYSPAHRTDMPTLLGCHNIEAADLNKDQWLDVVFVNNDASNNYVYWGSPDGYSQANMTALPAPPSTPHGVSCADLDENGYLDLVFTSVYDNQSYLYYGSADGYQTYQVLNTSSTYGGSAVCDIDGDDYLDIVFFRGWPSALQPLIYWGSSSGYSDANRTAIGYPTYGSGGFVADLNGDDYKDIFVNSRSSHSSIFWGPDYTTGTDIVVNNDHHAMFREIGNVYNRKYYEDYISSVFEASEVVDWGIVEWDDSLPEGTAILFWVRSGNTPVPDTSWADWFSLLNGDSIPAALDARYLQYKARLTYSNPCFLPSLHETRITYASSPEILASVRIEPEVINLKSHGKFTAFIMLPQGYNPHEIDIATVECEGAPALSGNAAAHHYIAKFNVQDLVGVSPGPTVEFEVTGQLYDGSYFHGYDTVRVIGNTPTITCTPNPCRRSTTITITNPSVTTDMRVTIHNVCGELVRTLETIDYSNGVGSVTWDRTDNGHRRVPQGVYLIKTYNDGMPVTNKIVVLSE